MPLVFCTADRFKAEATSLLEIRKYSLLINNALCGFHLLNTENEKKRKENGLENDFKILLSSIFS